MARILTLSTYPLDPARHGGQIRLSNICQAYRACGHEVQSVGVLGSKHYKPNPGFIAAPGKSKLRSKGINPSFMEDYVISELTKTGESLYDKLDKEVKLRPDLIHVEQPWLFDFAVALKSKRFPAAKLIYGSQNIEHKLKFGILSNAGLDFNASAYSELIRQKELTAAREADACFAVSAADASWLREITPKPVYLTPNGVRDIFSTNAGQASKWAQNYANSKNYAIYCGSAHPPNMDGFFAMLGGGCGSFQQGQRLLLVGGVGPAIINDRNRLPHNSELRHRIDVAGEIDDASLNLLLAHARCILLPLTHGGGTNLKTAEAIYTQNHVVATSTAMRGFESFVGHTGIQVADSAKEFKMAIRRALQSGRPEVPETEKAERRSVLWEETLKEAVVGIEKLT